MKATYEARLGKCEGDLITAQTIVSCINSQSKNLNIKNYGAKVDILGGYDFQNIGSQVKVRLSSDGKAEVEIQGDETQVRKTKSKLLKIVGGLELN